ncbi:MAG: hypothetical protein QOF51_1623 [Chloroflexota bacterium]|jgi:aryl-alcohol dehydrogenase-like predicted oxidoreductase|nr:hypothetical protein [Chloroflexota bacterium]
MELADHPEMTFRTLGRTGLEVSVVSLGTGGQSRLGQLTHGDRAASARVIRRALELGINLIDTAPNYADTEEFLGEVLGDVPRTAYLLATKAPITTRRGPATPDDIVASCEQSLRRLRTDYVDGLQLHNVGPEDYDAVVEHLYPALQRLKEQGKVRFLGLTERQEGRNGTSPGRATGDPAHAALSRALDDDIWDTIGVKYGVLNQVAEHEVFPKALARNVGVLNMSAVRVKLAQPDQLAALTADWKARGLLDEDALPERDPLEFLVKGDVPSVIAAGYKFALDHPAITSVLVGTGSVAHLEENVAAALGAPLPSADAVHLRKLFGHIAEGV